MIIERAPTNEERRTRQESERNEKRLCENSRIKAIGIHLIGAYTRKAVETSLQLNIQLLQARRRCNDDGHVPFLFLSLSK